MKSNKFPHSSFALDCDAKNYQRHESMKHLLSLQHLKYSH